MKTKIIFSVLALGALISSCKKEETTTAITKTVTTNTVTVNPNLTYLISKDSSHYGGSAGNSKVRLFEYNNSKKLVRVKYKNGTAKTYSDYDTIYYNNAGQISKVETYATGSVTAKAINVYHYTADFLTTVDETGTNGNGAYVRTRTFAGSGKVVSEMTVEYTTGSGPNTLESPDGISSVQFSSNNISSLSSTSEGPYYIVVTADKTAPNPYYGLNYKSDDFFNMFNPNNILKMVLAGSTTIADYSYTYANGRVSSISNAITTSTRIDDLVTDITYKGL